MSPPRPGERGQAGIDEVDPQALLALSTAFERAAPVGSPANITSVLNDRAVCGAWLVRYNYRFGEIIFMNERRKTKTRLLEQRARERSERYLRGVQFFSSTSDCTSSSLELPAVQSTDASSLRALKTGEKSFAATLPPCICVCVFLEGRETTAKRVGRGVVCKRVLGIRPGILRCS